MKEYRLKSLELYNSIPVPDWGPSLDGLNMDSISSYVRANTSMKGDWKEVPEDIKNQKSIRVSKELYEDYMNSSDEVREYLENKYGKIFCI